MQLLGIVEEKVYCRYGGENSQRHLEGSRLTQAMRAERGREEEEMETEEPGAKRPGESWETKEDT